MHPSRLALALFLAGLAATAAFAQQDPEALYDGAIQQFRADASAVPRPRVDGGAPPAPAAFLEPLRKTQDLDIEDRRALRLLADARVAEGRIDWKAHKDEQARSRFGEAVGEYELLLREPAGDRERLGLLGGLGRAYARALGGARGAAAASIPASSLWAPGAQASAELALVLPLGWRQQLVLGADLAHDDFGQRTFNFAGSETEAGRILQRTEDFGAALSWEAGSSRALRSLLKLSGGYRLAEDAELNALDLKASEKLDWRGGRPREGGVGGALSYALLPIGRAG